jgi:iron complex outermembrane receptor protein
MIRLLIAIVYLLPAWLYGQTGLVSGKVLSKETGEPLAGVNVRLEGTLRGTVTGGTGAFTLAGIPEGRHTFSFSLVGYQREHVRDIGVSLGEQVDLLVELSPILIQTEAVVVTASRREQSLEEVPSSLSVVDASTISQHNFVSIEDALRYVPGVNLVESQVSIRGSSGYSRGVGSRVLMLVDGIPLLPGDTGELNFETIPVGQVDRIEVLKGAGSALYGSNALGGVINVITKPIP